MTLSTQVQEPYLQPSQPPGPTYANVRAGDCLNVATLALGDAARLRSALGDYTARLLAHELDPPPDEAPNPAEGEEPAPSRNPAASQTHSQMPLSRRQLI